MNDTPTSTNDAGTAAPAVGTQIITLDPEQYVVAVFAPFRERLEAAKTEAAKVAVIDVTTGDGMKTAIAHRATFRNLRVEAEKARQSRKKPILEIGRLLDSRAKELEAEIEPLESRFDDAIKAEEERREAEKAAREKAEADRVARHHAALKDIRGALLDVAGRDSGAIDAKIRELVALDTSAAVFQEFAAEAETTREDTLTKLRTLHEATKRAEDEAAQVKAEREAFEREKAEQAERDRVAAAQRAEDDRRREAEERRIDDHRAALGALRAEPVYMVGKPAAVIEERLAALRTEKGFEDFDEFADEARAAHATAVQQLETMLADAQARERLKAEQDELEEKQRQARREQEEREAAARLEQEERERAERMQREEAERQERAAAERREREDREAQEAAEREQREREEAEARAREDTEREQRRIDLAKADIAERLKATRDEAEPYPEFAWFVAAFDKQMNPKPARKRAAAGA